MLHVPGLPQQPRKRPQSSGSTALWPEDPSSQDQGGDALGLLGAPLVCLSLRGWAGQGGGRRAPGGGGGGGREGAVASFPCSGPWPLSSPPHCVPGLAHCHSLCGGLSPPGEREDGGGPGPPPASKGRFPLPTSGPIQTQAEAPVAGSRQGPEPGRGGGFCCVVPPPSLTG